MMPPSQTFGQMLQNTLTSVTHWFLPVSRFEESGFREAVNAEQLGTKTNAARIVTLASAIIFPLFGFTGIDRLFAGEQAVLFLSLRIGCSLIFFALFALLRFERFRVLANAFSVTTILCMGISVAVMIRYLGSDSSYYAGLNVIYLASVTIPISGLATIILCAAIYACYIVPVLLFDLPGGFDAKVLYSNNLFQVVTFIVAALVNQGKMLSDRRLIISRLTIAKQAEDLRRRDHEKREFIANVTHELKTPLSIVLGNAEMALDIADEPRMREQLELIQRAAMQLANHVDRIIAISLADDPSQKPDLDMYDYCGIVRTTFDLFSTKAGEEGLDYQLSLPPGILVIQADVVRIEEVLTNLIQNAFKFTSAGGSIIVAVYTDEHDVITEVRDSGIGIASEKIDRIFERLYQADEVFSKRHSGIGIGLYLVKKNTELHGGSVSVHSVEGKGTTFTIRIPLHIDQTAGVKNTPFGGDDRRATPRRTGADRRADERKRRFEYVQALGTDDMARSTSTGNLRDYENRSPGTPTLLLVEDNPGMMKILIDALREEYNLLLAFDGFEGLSKLAEMNERVSLILSDVMMPGMSGYDFARSAYNDPRNRHIPLIFISALNRHEEQMQGYQAGATDYIVKPYNVRILKEKVAHWVSRRSYELLLRDMSATLESRVEQLGHMRDFILHEIRNPLQMITGAEYFVNRIKQDRQGEGDAGEAKLWESVGLLHTGIEALTGVLDSTQNIDMDALASRRPELLSDLVRDALSQVRHHTQGMEVTVEWTALGDTLILCDRRMIIQTIINLVRNATEAIRERGDSGNGKIRLFRVDGADDRITMCIEDNGIGMDKEVQEKLFQFKFTTKKDGTGVGLHLSRMMIKLHDGSLSVQSEAGSGTRFILELPVCTLQPPGTRRIRIVGS